jgi:TRAP-type mannitol/chloroaromatic compound transport system substrate-binding protein
MRTLNLRQKKNARNPAAVRRLAAGGTELRAFSQPIMEAALTASNEVNAETAAANADFKRVLGSMQAFRNDEYFWCRSPSTVMTPS